MCIYMRDLSMMKKMMRLPYNLTLRMAEPCPRTYLQKDGSVLGQRAILRLRYYVGGIFQEHIAVSPATRMQKEPRRTGAFRPTQSERRGDTYER